MKVKSLLAIFAIATLLVSITGSYSGFSAYADDSIDDSHDDSIDDSKREKPYETEREKLKEEIKEFKKEEKENFKEFREEYKAKLEEKKKQFKDYKKDLREKYNALKGEYKEKYKQLRISTSASLDKSVQTDSSSDGVGDQNYQLEIKREELKLLKQDFREQIKSLKLDAREHFNVLKSDMKTTLEDRKNKMHDRINALKEHYKQKIIEHVSSNSIDLDGYPSELSGKKVIVCHMPPGNSDNPHTLSISVNALKAHLAHDDYLDECEDESNEDKTEEGKHFKVELKEELGVEQSN